MSTLSCENPSKACADLSHSAAHGLVASCFLVVFLASACSHQETPTDTAASPPPDRASMDVCNNYPGIQTAADLLGKGFIQKEGLCTLPHNHQAFALSGVDQARLDGWSGQGITLAIIDSGFRSSHEAFQQVLQVATYQDGNANFQLDREDKLPGDAASVGAHGTAVAGILGGRGTGVAPAVGLHLNALRDENPRLRDVAIALKEAVALEEIALINLSLNTFSKLLLYRSTTNDNTGILAAVAQSRAVIIAAAGNSGLDLSQELDNAQYQQTARQSFLAAPFETSPVLLVGTYSPEQQALATYSNYPGHRTDLQARFLVSAGDTLTSASSGGDSLYRSVGGSSFSAAIVSGALALLLEAHPQLTPQEAALIILATAQRPDDLGYGTMCTSTTKLGDFTSDCGAMKFGRGILDLSAALAHAEAMQAIVEK